MIEEIFVSCFFFFLDAAIGCCCRFLLGGYEWCLFLFSSSPQNTPSWCRSGRSLSRFCIEGGELWVFYIESFAWRVCVLFVSLRIICDHISRRFLLRYVNAAIAIDGTKFPPTVISKDPDDPNKTIITMLSVCIQCSLQTWISPWLNIFINTVATFITQRLQFSMPIQVEDYLSG